MSSPKRLLLALTVFYLLASACTPSGTALPITLLAVSTATQTLTPIPTLTATQLPTETPNAPTIFSTGTLTLLPTIPTFTPTFDARTIVTATPAPKAECPVINSNLEPDLGLPQKMNIHSFENEPFSGGGIGGKILEFLNEGGDYHKLISTIQNFNARNSWNINSPIIRDVTGDSIPDIIFRDVNHFPATHVFSCQQGKYTDFIPMSPALSGWPINLYKILDLNADGIPEIIFSGYLYIYEWDGQNFENLNDDPTGIGAVGLVDFELSDIDKNQTIEIILKRGGPGPLWNAFDEMPSRSYTAVYGWNGQKYILASKEFGSPQYRFQAIQDADRYTLNKDYDKAISLYQEAIFNNKLEWWSAERRQYLINMYDQDYQKTPKIFPTPIPDLAEYPKLAAYAYYRMVILHTRLGHTDAAATQYATLQKKFPAASPGRPYVEMASAFWDAYQSSQNMTDACGAAIAYAAAHPDMLTVLGSDYHGDQSHKYVPADVCPFR